MIVTNTLPIDGRTAIDDLVCGRPATGERDPQGARDTALTELRLRAHALGLKAVGGGDLEGDVLGQGNGMPMVSASGTAVVVQG